MANYRGELQGKSIVNTKATVTLPKDNKVIKLRDVAVNVQRMQRYHETDCWSIPLQTLGSLCSCKFRGLLIRCSLIPSCVGMVWLSLTNLREITIGGGSQTPPN